jgi:hypothetical protein
VIWTLYMHYPLILIFTFKSNKLRLYLNWTTYVYLNRCSSINELLCNFTGEHMWTISYYTVFALCTCTSIHTHINRSNVVSVLNNMFASELVESQLTRFKYCDCVSYYDNIRLKFYVANPQLLVYTFRSN